MIRLITYSAIVMFAVGAAILYFFFTSNPPAGMLAITTAMFAAATYHSLEAIDRLQPQVIWIPPQVIYLGEPAQVSEPEPASVEPHPNKEEVEKGVAEGKAWQIRLKGNENWITWNPPVKPLWAANYEYRLAPIEEPPSKSEPNPHPNRAEVEVGIAAGRAWEMRGTFSPNCVWSGAFGSDVTPSWDALFEYRLTPEPEYVPLGPEDVPPGSEFKRPTYSKGTGVAIIGHNEKGFWYMNASAELCFVAYAEAMEYDGQINRSLPLTGRWNPDAWEPCRKLKS